MDAIAPTADLPVPALLRTRSEQPRIPNEGTTIVRPSTRSTASVSSVKLTFFKRSPGLISEACIPFFHQDLLSQSDGFQPEFRGLIVAIHMHMGGSFGSWL